MKCFGLKLYQLSQFELFLTNFFLNTFYIIHFLSFSDKPFRNFLTYIIIENNAMNYRM